MSILKWDMPARVMTPEEYNAISADSAPPGVYSGNMSREDAYAWKARKVGGARARVEIRKTVSGKDPMDERHGCYAQLVIIVMADGRIKWSQNGAAVLTPIDFADMAEAVAEAAEALAPKPERTYAEQVERSRRAKAAVDAGLVGQL